MSALSTGRTGAVWSAPEVHSGLPAGGAAGPAVAELHGVALGDRHGRAPLPARGRVAGSRRPQPGPVDAPGRLPALPGWPARALHQQPSRAVLRMAELQMKVSCSFRTWPRPSASPKCGAYSKPHASRADPSWWSCSRTPSRPHPTPQPMAYRTLGRAAEQLRSGHDTGHQRTKLRAPASIFSPRIRRTLGLKRARRATDQPSSQLMVAETVESRWLRTKSCRRTTRCHSHARTAGTRHTRPWAIACPSASRTGSTFSGRLRYGQLTGLRAVVVLALGAATRVAGALGRARWRSG